MPEAETLAQVIERLYGLPLEEFTAERDAAAKALRAAGDRDAATEVKRLRKPSRLAWALNQVRRQDSAAVDDLLAAGQRLQDAQRQLVEAGERGLLRDAAAEERELVGKVAELAERELAASGHPANATAQGKLFSTLHAAAADPEVRAELAAGRLLGEHQISDLGLVPGVPVAGDEPDGVNSSTAGGAARAGGVGRAGGAARAGGGARPGGGARAGGVGRTEDAAERKAREAADRKARAAAQREARQLTTKLERARDRRRTLAKEQKEAERGLADAEKAAERAAAAVKRAEVAAQRARAAADEAGGRVDELEAQLHALDPAT
jgi:hypothetical protein